MEKCEPNLDFLSTRELATLAAVAFETLATRGEPLALATLARQAGEAIGRAFPTQRTSATSASSATSVPPSYKRDHVDRCRSCSLKPQHHTGDASDTNVTPAPTKPEITRELPADIEPGTLAPPSPTAAIPMTMYAINEAEPGQQWKSLFDATWPGYRVWYLAPDGRPRPDLQTARSQLATHMPELIPTYDRLVALSDHDELAATMLTLWDPPRFLPGCSQIALIEPELMLCRNYDYDPNLFECVTYSSNFTRPVIGTSDCLWGLLDGMNDAGLVVSLTFGGEQGSGPGFAIPLVVRYLLEVADTAAQARQVIARIPVNMSYNLTMIDATGERITVFVSPDSEPMFFDDPLATNHRGQTPTDLAHARKFRSVERRERLVQLSNTDCDANTLAAAFLESELRSTDYAGAFGTLYTALYRPERKTVEYHWPDQTWVRSFDSEQSQISVTLKVED